MRYLSHLRRPRFAQPQGMLRVNPEFRPVFVVAGDLDVDLVSGQRTIQTATGLKRLPFNSQRSIDFVGNGRVDVPMNDDPVATTWIISYVTFANNDLGRPITRNGANMGRDIYLYGYTEFQHCYAGGWAGHRWGVVPNGEVTNLVLAHDASAGGSPAPNVFVNGARQGLTTTNSNAGSYQPVTAGTPMRLGNGDALNRRLNGRVFMCAVLPYALAPSIARDLSANPWQVFA